MKNKKNRTPVNPPEMDPKRKQERILDQLGMMKHKDLVIACISRGLPFEDVVKLDHNGLGSFYIKNFDSPENADLLNQYDLWLDDLLEKRGHKKGDAIMSPLLRVGYVGKGDFSDAPPKMIEPGSAKKIPDQVPKDKVKREKDEETGVVVGTKKNLTYKLAQQGVELDKVIEQVKKQFSDAQEKSIKIWYKRALKEKDGED